MSFKEMTKEQRDRAILKVLILVVVAIALYIFGIQPLVRTNRARNEESQELAARIQRADRTLRRETEIRANAERVRRAIREKLDTQLPPVENPLLWATQIAYRHAADGGMEIRSISEESYRDPVWLRSESTPSRRGGSRDSEETTWRSFAPYAVQVTVESSFPDILLLLAALERDHPMVNISSLTLNSDSRMPSIQIASVTLQWPRLAVPFPPAIQAFLEDSP